MFEERSIGQKLITVTGEKINNRKIIRVAIDRILIPIIKKKFRCEKRKTKNTNWF